MGGDSGGGSGGGGRIIIHSVVAVFKDPTVAAQIPVAMRGAFDPVVAKDPAAWTEAERRVFCNVVDWAIMSGR